MKTQVKAWGPRSVLSPKGMSRVMPARAGGGMALEYAQNSDGLRKGAGEGDFGREREKIKEQLMPFIREAVKKQLREERDYYKSRPSLAAKQYEGLFQAGLGNSLVPAVSRHVFGVLEEQMRREWLRKGG